MDDEINVNVNWHVDRGAVAPRLETARALVLAIHEQGDTLGALWTGTWEAFMTDAEQMTKDDAWSAIHELVRAFARAMSSASVAMAVRDSDDAANASQMTNLVFDIIAKKTAEAPPPEGDGASPR